MANLSRSSSLPEACDAAASKTLRVANAKSGGGIVPDMMGSKPVAFFLPNLCLGGAEKVTVQLANGLAARGYAIDMVLATAKGEFLGELAPAIRVVDLKARRILTAIPRFAKYLRKHRPLVVISALEHVNVGAILARQLSVTSVPVIVAIHATRSMATMFKRGFRRHLLRFGARWCYRRASAMVCVSQGVADDLAAVTEISRERLRVIYNPVVSGRILDLAREPLDHPWFAPELRRWCWQWEG